MQKNKANILFMANDVASENIAWHFLHNANLFTLEENFENNQNLVTFQNYNLNKKHIKQIDIIIHTSKFNEKMLNPVTDKITAKTLVLTSDIATYVCLKSLKMNVSFITSKTSLEKQTEKLTLQSCVDIDCKLSKTLSFKTDTLLISKALSNQIITACVFGYAVKHSKPVSRLMLSYKARKNIIKNISECIKLTNSVMLTVEKFKGFNFYHFLSGKGFLKSVKQHFKMFCLLYSLRKNAVDQNLTINSVNSLIDLNFNNYVELKSLIKLKK